MNAQKDPKNDYEIVGINDETQTNGELEKEKWSERVSRNSFVRF